jgi:ABC-type phosphate/phosphonate transport system ATPase subunit
VSVYILLTKWIYRPEKTISGVFQTIDAANKYLKDVLGIKKDEFTFESHLASASNFIVDLEHTHQLFRNEVLK